MKRSQREAELRRAVAFIDRLTRRKLNARQGIVAYGGGLERKPREHFLDYCERVASDFPVDHPLKRRRRHV